MSDLPSSQSTPAACSLCANLKSHEYGYQKYGWPDDDVYLPAAVEKLQTIRDFAPLSGRARQLRQCLECGAYYLYQTDYEYLVNGSEDEQFLTHLTWEQADAYLQQ